MSLPGRYRTLVPWEREAYAAHLLSLPREDRAARFAGGVGAGAVRDHARRVLAAPRARVIGWFHEGALRAAVELVWSSGGVAEAAFTVEPAWRRQGVGRGLASRAARQAALRGLGPLHVVTTRENAAMRALAARMGAALRTRGGWLEGEVPLAPRTPLTLAAALAEEEAGAWGAWGRLWLEAAAGAWRAGAAAAWMHPARYTPSTITISESDAA